MLKGNLKLLVLKLVSSKEMSGYELMKSIKEKTGRKPSPGSIYPLLEDLKKTALISVKEVGRSKKYSLTTQGQEQLDQFLQQKDILMKKIKTAIGVFCTMTGQSEKECIQSLHQDYMEEKKKQHTICRTEKDYK